MDKKRTYFPPTSEQQRGLLFEIWEETGDRKEACRRARVSEGTFYKWKARYEAHGDAGLKERRSRAPHTFYQTPREVEEQVVRLKQEHREWGKRRISEELAKGNNWVALASPNTVRRILQDAGLWSADQSKAKKGGSKALPARQKRLDRR